MSLRSFATIALLILLLVLSLHVQLYAQTELPRHTLGFPETENISLEDLVNVLSQLDTVETLSQLQNNPQLREYIAESIHKLKASKALGPEDTRAIEKVLSSNASISELMRYIKDPSVQSVLSKLAILYKERGTVPREQIENALKLISSSHSSGRISTEDYLLALEVLKRISYLSNESSLVNLLDRESLKILKEFISDAYMNKLTESLSGANSIVKQFQPPVPSEYSKPIGGFISAFPSIALRTLPSFPSTILLLAVGTIAIAILLALFVPKIMNLVRRAVAVLRIRKAVSAVMLKDFPKSVELYWRSIERVAAITGVIKSDIQTHREYLKVVEDRLGEFSKPFREITQYYEIVRFGGALDPEIEKRIEEAYRKLVSKR